MFIRDDKTFLSRSEAAALLAFACKDEERAHLHGVFFDPNTGHAVSTDGHRLAALATKEGETAVAPRFTVPYLTFQTAIKACPAIGVISVKNGEIEIHAEDQASLFPDALASLPFTGPTADFPPYADVIPAMHRGGKRAPSIAFNADLLASLALVAKACEGPECVMHVPPTALDAALYCMGEWRVVIMPCSSKKTDEVAP